MLFGFGVLLFFFLLGGRSLNEPDEGRYAEVAREMLETGNWLTPHIWYVPHIDKPPLTYWMVAISMSVFGQNEWAVRLPLALAGLSGLGAVWCLGNLMGGARVGLWSGLILASSLLYFVMARMLTTDIILTQFIAWAIFFLWQAWEISAQQRDFREIHHFRRLPFMAFGRLVDVGPGFSRKRPDCCGSTAFCRNGISFPPAQAMRFLARYRFRNRSRPVALFPDSVALVCLSIPESARHLGIHGEKASFWGMRWAQPSKTEKDRPFTTSASSRQAGCRGRYCWAGCGERIFIVLLKKLRKRDGFC